jgi:hypothetical protein
VSEYREAGESGVGVSFTSGLARCSGEASLGVSFERGLAKHPGGVLLPPFGGGIVEEWFCAVLPLAGGVPQGFAGLAGRSSGFSGDFGGFH